MASFRLTIVEHRTAWYSIAFVILLAASIPLTLLAAQGKASDRQLSIAEDRLVENLKDLADIIHKNGSKTVMQINHSGSTARKEVTGMEPVGPSAARHPLRYDVVPKALDKNEITEIVNEFKAA